MKKVFMPNEADMIRMQNMGADIYSYIEAKVIETLIIEGVNYSRKGILNPNYTYKYILEDPNIIIPICKMYPELIGRVDYAKNDASLCLELLNRDIPSSNCPLDKMLYFDQNMILNNKLIIDKVITLLTLELKRNPKYRFTYKDHEINNVNLFYRNLIFDKIFSTKIITDQDNLYLFGYNKLDLLKRLSYIEPYYIMMMDDSLIDGFYYNKMEFDASKRDMLIKSMNNYLERYEIDRKEKKIDFDNPDEKVKRYLRVIKKDENLIY